MCNPGCNFYNGGVCKYIRRIEGLGTAAVFTETLCSHCDAITEDEIDALCDNDIVGFLLLTCVAHVNRNTVLPVNLVKIQVVINIQPIGNGNLRRRGHEKYIYNQCTHYSSHDSYCHCSI